MKRNAIIRQKMSSLILMTLAVIPVFLACKKTEMPELASDVENGTTIINAIVEICGDNGTKTETQTVAESKVNALQVFVFGKDGELEDMRSGGSVTSLGIAATAGIKTLWAVTNCAAMTDIVSEADLKARLTDLSSNRGSNFVMAGSVAAELTDGAKVTVSVMRLVSKVILKKVSTDWVSAAYQTRKFTVNSIYMTNVAGECNLAADATPSKWYNKLSHKDASLDALLYRETKAVIANKGSYQAEQSFYVYPNPVDESSSSGTWTPRRTMLVLDCTLGEERMYYPVEMPVIGRNKTYTIDEILITRKGSDNPWEPVIIGESEVGVTVSDWELGLNIDKVTF